MKKVLIVFVLLALIGGFAFAAGQEETGDSSGDDIITINVSHQPAFSHGLLYMARDKGWLEEEGLDLNLILFESGILQEEAMASGNVDISMIGSTAVIIGAQRKLVDQRCFGIAAEVTPLFTIISNDSTVKDPGDLKGKTVVFTVGSSMQYFLDMALAKFGLTEDDINVIHMEPSDAQIAYLAGNADAIVPLATQIWVLTSNDEDSRIIFDGSQLASPPGEIVETKIIDLIVATYEFAEENPVAMDRFQKLWFRCVDYINDPATRADAIASVQKWKNDEFNAGLLYDDAEWMMDRYFFFDAEATNDLFATGNVQSSLSREADFYVSSNKIPAPPAADDYISGKYVANYLGK